MSESTSLKFFPSYIQRASYINPHVLPIQME